jgi:hypothetical protein
MKMSVHKKLMEARLKLQATKLSKSGHNKFAGYQYFELGDFLPTVQGIFAELNLCGVVSFTADLATLTITDTEDGSNVIVSSPMGSAALKGCHEVQNIGAVETYQRRYLWVTAMEIVEHDALDAVTGTDSGEPAKKAVNIQKSAAPLPEFTKDRLLAIDVAVSSAIEAYNEGRVDAAHDFIYVHLRDNEEILEAWNRLKTEPTMRNAIKKYRLTIQPQKEAA